MSTRAIGLWGLFLFFAFGIIYFVYRSPFLDDPDAANFALGLIQFDPLSGSPHPPGYPLYIAIGKVFRWFSSSETSALTTLSALSGALLIPFAYFFLRAYLPAEPVLLAVTLFASLPLTALEATKAMTDIPGLAAALFVLAVAHSLKGFKGSTLLFGMLLGMLGGIRPHTWLFTFPILLALIPRKSWLMLAGGFLIGCAIWLVPTCILTGPGAYFDVVARMFLGRFCEPQITPLAARFAFSSWLHRLAEFLYFSLFSGVGISFDGMRWWDWLMVSALGGMIALVIAKGRALGSSMRPLRVGMAIYFVYLLLFLPTSNARYFLPIILLIFAECIARLSAHSQKTALLVTACLTVLFLAKSKELLEIRNATPPPALASVRTLQDLHSVSPIFVTGFQNSYYRYYWPNAPFLEKSGTYCEILKRAIAEKKETYTSSLIVCPDVRVQRLETFRRDARVHWKSNELTLFKVFDK